MAQTKRYEGSVADRLERLPFSKFHRNFLLMLSAGEWAESLMLLGNGAILALLSAYYGLKGRWRPTLFPHLSSPVNSSAHSCLAGLRIRGGGGLSSSTTS
ncbi:hypothetical protein HS1genome_1797 [Sulfodiicoccus acidiphilus]|uniref:Uncharacterized protein n=1 Tax=Sulfodiicoccus acidiphilus TaxID=1670455 RepID=A0A348B5F6_9CREN|nr:hypothetical protein [Sulfodiicoccus acidiphilus]BBD73408.1 hypothetical protein HS1genome_1797 [Sulfodiicoccus acidiphilus]